MRWVCPLRWVLIAALSSHLLLKPKYFHLDKNQSMVKIKKPSITLEYHFFPVVYFWSIHFGVLKAQMSIVSSCSPFNQLLQHSSISFQAIYFHQTFVAFFPPVQTQKQSSQIEFDSKYKQTDLSRSDVTANIVPFAWCWLCFDFELWTLNTEHCAHILTDRYLLSPITLRLQPWYMLGCLLFVSLWYEIQCEFNVPKILVDLSSLTNDSSWVRFGHQNPVSLLHISNLHTFWLMLLHSAHHLSVFLKWTFCGHFKTVFSSFVLNFEAKWSILKYEPWSVVLVKHEYIGQSKVFGITCSVEWC